jgi:hypothetical protein
MAGLSASQIISANDTKVEPVEVPEWGGTVYVRVLRGTDRDHFEEWVNKEKDKSVRCRFLVLSLCDETGGLLFKPEQVTALGEKSGDVLARVFDRAWEINYLSPKAVEELGKDSPSGQSDGSTTVSR